MSTTYVARVERVYYEHGRKVVVICPFCWQEHAHPWEARESRPSAEVLAGCSGVDDLSVYAIDEATALAADRRHQEARPRKAQGAGRRR